MPDREPNGRMLQRYRLLEEVGQGGMAVVYKGFDTTLNREVAVKVLHPHLAGMEESRARLQREAHAVAKLRHENILEIFDYSGPDSPESYIVTEFIHGKTLKTFLQQHPLAFPELAEMIVSEVARALEHAHQLGVIHRDIKPENVMIRDDGLVKLMDFGIAQIVDKERMTVTGQLLGSPAYMAPEHVEGKPLDFRTDVFAVGILLYQLATGQLPFRGRNPHEVLKRIAECRYQPPELQNPLVGARLGRVIGKALQREPQDRFADVAPLRKELLENLEDAGVSDPRKELQQFFADPDGWTRAFKPRLVSQLARRGKELEQKGRTAAALELWSRALAVDPKSAELTALVDGVARKRRLGRVALVGASMIAGAAALSFGVMKALDHAVPAPAEIAHRHAVQKPIAVQPKPIEKPTPVEQKPETRVPKVKKALAHAEGPKPQPPSATRRVTVDATPAGGLSIALDEGELEPFSPTREWELDDKPHVFHLQSPFLMKKDLKVAPGEAGRIAVTMHWRPAHLVVHARPDSADVIPEGKPPIRSGDAIDVLFSDPRSPLKELKVHVSAPGYRSQTITVPMQAGKDEERTVELVKLDGE